MKVRDLLPYLNANVVVYIYFKGECFNYYDGKNSVSLEHCELYVQENGIYPKPGAIEIYAYK